jgi:hypothetical protein
MRTLWRNIARSLPVVVLLCGCRAAGWSVSMNSDSMSPTIGLHSRSESKELVAGQTQAQRRAAANHSEEPGAEVSSGPEDGLRAKSDADAAVSSRTRFSTWLAQRRRRSPERIPFPVTETPAVEPALREPADEF